MDHVFYSNTSAGNFTESEKVFLSPGQHRIRFDHKGQYTGGVISSTGTESITPGYVKYEEMIWWVFVQNHMYQYDNRPCLPPYNNTYYFNPLFPPSKYQQLPSSANKNCLNLTEVYLQVVGDS